MENDCYTSKLDTVVSPGLNGRTASVDCIIDDGITNTVMDTSTLSIKNIKYIARF